MILEVQGGKAYIYVRKIDRPEWVDVNGVISDPYGLSFVSNCGFVSYRAHESRSFEATLDGKVLFKQIGRYVVLVQIPVINGQQESIDLYRQIDVFAE